MYNIHCTQCRDRFLLSSPLSNSEIKDGKTQIKFFTDRIQLPRVNHRQFNANKFQFIHKCGRV